MTDTFKSHSLATLVFTATEREVPPRWSPRFSKVVAIAAATSMVARCRSKRVEVDHPLEESW